MLGALKDESPAKMRQTDQVDVVEGHVRIPCWPQICAVDSSERRPMPNEFLGYPLRPHNRTSRYGNADRLPSPGDSGLDKGKYRERECPRSARQTLHRRHS